jgi:putative transposase
VGLKLTFLIVSRVVSLLRLSRREAWWKDTEILMLRHQLAVAQRERPRVHARLTWPDRTWLALLAGTLPVAHLAGMRLIVRRRWADCDEVPVPVHCFCRLGDRTNNV